MGRSVVSYFLHLTTETEFILNELSKKKGISKAQVLKTALSIYYNLDIATKDGEEIVIRDPNRPKNEKIFVIFDV